MKIVTTEKTIEDITHWPAEKRSAVKYSRIQEIDGEEKTFAVYPKGTEVVGAQANQLLKIGKAKVVE